MLTGVQSQKISLFQYSHLHGKAIISFRYRYFQYPWGYCCKASGVLSHPDQPELRLDFHDLDHKLYHQEKQNCTKTLLCIELGKPMSSCRKIVARHARPRALFERKQTNTKLQHLLPCVHDSVCKKIYWRV